jgi:hypothetical protein
VTAPARAFHATLPGYGAAALAGVRRAAGDAGLAGALGLDAGSVVVLVSTEGITANPVTTGYH